MTDEVLKQLVGLTITAVERHGSHGDVFELHLSDRTLLRIAMSDYTHDLYFEKVKS